jgi:hypothetical protein
LARFHSAAAAHRRELLAGNTYIVSVGKRFHAKIKLAKA